MISTKHTLLIDKKEQILFFIEANAEGYLILSGSRKVLVTDSRYYHGVVKKVSPKVSVVLGDLNTAMNFLDEKIGIDYSSVSVQTYKKLTQSFQVFDATEIIDDLISKKTLSHQKLIKKACQISERAFLETIPYIKKGVSELELASELDYRIKKSGGGNAFETIVAFGANSAVAHHQSGNTQLEDNQAVLMDFGCKYNGFCSDMTRTLFFGKPDDKFLNAYEAVKMAHITAKNAIIDSMTGFDVDLIAREYLRKFDLDQYFTHALGHGIGVCIHEYPTLSPKSKSVLKNGNIFSIEPAVYFVDQFGIRIEDTILLDGNKAKSLMTVGLELIQI